MYSQNQRESSIFMITARYMIQAVMKIRAHQITGPASVPAIRILIFVGCLLTALIELVHTAAPSIPQIAIAAISAVSILSFLALFWFIRFEPL
jgi:glucan phosphoethanolaminetransferase (alkaline phosphatase superfamily)